MYYYNDLPGQPGCDQISVKTKGSLLPKMPRDWWKNPNTIMLVNVVAGGMGQACLVECVKQGSVATGVSTVLMIPTVLLHNIAGVYTIHSCAMSAEARR